MSAATAPDEALVLARPVIRVVEAGLGPDAQVRLVVSGNVDLERLRTAWVSSGATVAPVEGRLHATTTVSALARAAGRAFGADDSRAIETVLRGAIQAWTDAPRPVTVREATLATDLRPAVMGVLNVTPDSFSDGGEAFPGDGADGHPAAAVAQGRRLIAEGADIIDVGGESTRPGAEPVDERTELSRVIPVIEQLAGPEILISIDTTKPGVARAALAAGADIVNDVGGGRNRTLLEVTAEAGAGYVLMHTRGTPADMQQRTDYDDVVAEVYEYLCAGLQRVTDAGIAAERVLLDPGVGFAKTAEHNLSLLRATRQLSGLGRPVLVGASRKSFLGTLLDGAPAGQRLEGSLACAVLAVAEGAAAVRVHDVAATVNAVRVARAVVTGAVDWAAVVQRG